MGSWDTTQLGFSCDESYRWFVKKLLECLDVDFGVQKGLYEDPFYSMGPDDYGEFYGSNVLQVFLLVNRFFDNTTIYYVHEIGNTINDTSYRYEEVYDPKEYVVKKGKVDYSWDGMMTFGKSVYNILKNECESRAESLGVPVEWKELYYGIIPATRDFESVCEVVLNKHEGIRNIGRRSWGEALSETEIDYNIITNLIDKAAIYEHYDVIEWAQDTFKIDYISPYLRKTTNGIVKTDEWYFYKYSKVARRIHEYNSELETMSLCDFFDRDSLCQKEFNGLNDGTILQIRSDDLSGDKLNENDEIPFYIGDIVVGKGHLYRIPPEALGLSDTVRLWFVVKRKRNGHKYLKLDYQFLNLDYDSIISELKGIFRPESKNLKQSISYICCKQYGDYFQYYSTTEYFNAEEFYKASEMMYVKKMAFNIAGPFGISVMNYDKGVIVNKSVLLRLALEAIGNRFLLMDTEYDGRTERIESMKIGASLDVVLLSEPLNSRFDLRYDEDSIGILPQNVSALLAGPLNDWSNVISAEVVEVYPRSKRQYNAKKGLVYVKVLVGGC